MIRVNNDLTKLELLLDTLERNGLLALDLEETLVALLNEDAVE